VRCGSPMASGFFVLATACVLLLGSLTVAAKENRWDERSDAEEFRSVVEGHKDWRKGDYQEWRTTTLNLDPKKPEHRAKVFAYINKKIHGLKQKLAMIKELASKGPAFAKQAKKFTSKLSQWLTLARRERDEYEKQGITSISDEVLGVKPDLKMSQENVRTTKLAETKGVGSNNFNIYTGNKESDISIPLHDIHDLTEDEGSKEAGKDIEDGRVYTYHEWKHMKKEMKKEEEMHHKESSASSEAHHEEERHEEEHHEEERHEEAPSPINPPAPVEEKPRQKQPTWPPTLTPTIQPTLFPSVFPTFVPSTDVPTPVPTVDPTPTPSEPLTKVPTLQPTLNPTKTPSNHPTIYPTLNPTLDPSEVPSFPLTHPPHKLGQAYTHHIVG